MRQELEEHLFTKYPLLYRLRHDKRSLMRDFSLGDGWFHILDELSAGLEEIIKQQPENERIAAVQVKEKFAGLRFYTQGTLTQQAIALIRNAEKLADKTCEVCGAKGEITGTVWVRTLCKPCESKQK